MATSFVDVLLQVRDEFGAEALAGGKIQTYEAGTTTPLATYQDLGGATANTNPVILDSAGMAIIRQTDGVAYKWLVYDSDDNLLFTRDNITVGTSSSASGDDYLVHVSCKGTPGAQGFMGGHIFDDSVTFPIDFEGAQAAVRTNPGSDYVISIQKNAVEVGTLTIWSSGAATFATTGGVTVSVASGDTMYLIAPDSVGTAEDFVISIPGAVA